MGKFKEIETVIYNPENEYTGQHFVQPTIVGLIEIFKNFSTALEVQTKPETPVDEQACPSHC